jgi:hypothetical protein
MDSAHHMHVDISPLLLYKPAVKSLLSAAVLAFCSTGNSKRWAMPQQQAVFCSAVTNTVSASPAVAPCCYNSAAVLGFTSSSTAHRSCSQNQQQRCQQCSHLAAMQQSTGCFICGRRKGATAVHQGCSSDAAWGATKVQQGCSSLCSSPL